MGGLRKVGLPEYTMNKRAASLAALAVLPLFLCGCGTGSYLMGQTIRPGMTLAQVYHRMGRPDVGWGLPEQGSTNTSWLFYEIPFRKYLVVNFDGDKVGKPPISIENRNVLVP
jgi:hypothetical protein